MKERRKKGEGKDRCRDGRREETLAKKKKKDRKQN